MAAQPVNGFLRVVSEGALQEEERQERERFAQDELAAQDERAKAELGAGLDFINWVRTQWRIALDHRSSSGLDRRLLHALRTWVGEYDPQQLAEIRRFGGSEVYARLTSNKCRGATSLLRDIYFGAERPWELETTPDPEVREDVMMKVFELVQGEIAMLRQEGMPVDEAMVIGRMKQLRQEAKRAAMRQARQATRRAEDVLDDKLLEGGFYDALAEFLVDLPLFPYAVIKGPFVRMVEDVVWVDPGEEDDEDSMSGGALGTSPSGPVPGGPSHPGASPGAAGPSAGAAPVPQGPPPGSPQPGVRRGDRVAKTKIRPRMMWERCSPFDVYFTPGAGSLRQSDVFYRCRWTRMDLMALRGLPGWDDRALNAVLTDYDGGLRDWMDPVDSERAADEDREDPTWNRSEFIDVMNYHGAVPGDVLRDLGLGEADGVDDINREYMVEAWIIGSYVLKTHVSPSPRKRHPFHITSFEKTPGTITGQALPEILEDVQQMANATMRALSNNMAMASGPQVVILDNRFAETTDTDDLYPWKRWHMIDEPGQGALPPVAFYQPSSNAAELLSVYQRMTEMADEISAIPKYLTGGGAPGGAGRTASGLSMLMGNANKMLQQVVFNVDHEIIEPVLVELYDLMMLDDDEGLFTGDEAVVVKGASMVTAKEAERSRQLEFLQITANPMDSQIVGTEGRATILREIARDIGLRGANIVPDESEMAMRMQQAEQSQQAAAQAQGGQAPGPGGGEGPQQNDVTTRNAGNMQGG